MQAIILAGGKGTRLHPITSSTPKPMVSFFGRPVMEHCVRLLAKHGFADILVTVAHMANDIIDYFGDGSAWGVKMRYSVEKEPRGTAGGIKLLEDMIEEPFLVISGDAITDFDLTAVSRYHFENKALVTLAAHRVEDPTQYGLVQRAEDGRIERFLEKPKSRDQIFTNLVNTGIYMMHPSVLSLIPKDTFFDFSRHVFPRLLSEDKPLYACELDGYWCDIGNLAQYRAAHFDALLGKAEIDVCAREVEKGVWLGKGVRIHETAKLSAPVFVGEGARINRHAVLEGFSVIGDGSLVAEGASVTRSILGSRAYIGRATHVIDSLIGDGYRLQANDPIFNCVVVDGIEKQIYPVWDLPGLTAPEPERSWASQPSSLAA